ncbi:uncharacterized protein ARMOST_13840 [Armillaria ostoyae]|uniref:Reverse transcriptase domain-containing protein n=1 Tax=Armillaria ostoyae TaxID=47428 RepID=A0A284RP04_ARMOS|nr:uncharacterized protein ARMOST_13840 [Armillaria ostoyae]
MTIGGHSECIDLAITDLGTKDVYLGHDWLKWHNPIVNWKTGAIIFGRCQCAKNPFTLPDADPKDQQICPSKSPFALPFFFVKKKNGTLHSVPDYRKLNEMTIKNWYPLPLIAKLINKLWGTKYFTKLDI